MRARPATPDDLDELAEMGAALALMHAQLDPLRFMGGDSRAFVVGYRSWFARELSRRKACLLVIDGDAGLAGYCYGSLAPVDWASLLDEHAALVDVYVRPSARRQGIAEVLVRAFCEWAKDKAPRVVLSTATQNREAQALFAKLGFRPTMIEMTRESDR